MGREIKRVPLDFDWLLNKTWKGFLNPHWDAHIDCPHCGGNGESPEYRFLKSLWYSHLHDEARRMIMRDDITDRKLLDFATEIFKYRDGWFHHLDQEDVKALVEGGRLWDFTRRPRTDEQIEIVKKKVADGGNSWLPEDNGYVPTAEEVNEWSRHGFGHDSINCWICISARLKRYGIEETSCKKCGGNGYTWPDDEAQRKYDEWEEYEPPEGEGWQMWETVTEGSPITPVFATPEELIDYMCQPNDDGSDHAWDRGYTREGATNFVMKSGWAPSGIAVGGKYYSGVDGLVRGSDEE